MRKLLIALALVTASTACAAAEEPPAAAPTSSALPTGSDKSSPDIRPPTNAAPNFTVTTFEGERFSLGEQRGTPVVLNFWESW